LGIYKNVILTLVWKKDLSWSRDLYRKFSSRAWIRLFLYQVREHKSDRWEPYQLFLLPVHDRSIYARAILLKFIIRECKQTNLPILTLIIVFITCHRRYKTPFLRLLKGADAITTCKSWYYNTIDQNPKKKSRRQITDNYGISKNTGWY
jgi:hypothetical protein